MTLEFVWFDLKICVIDTVVVQTLRSFFVVT